MADWRDILIRLKLIKPEEEEEPEEVPEEIAVDETGDITILPTDDSTGTEFQTEMTSTADVEPIEEPTEESEDDILKEVDEINGNIKDLIAKMIQDQIHKTDDEYLGDIIPTDVEIQMAKDSTTWILYQMVLLVDRVVAHTQRRQKEIDDARKEDMTQMRENVEKWIRWGQKMFAAALIFLFSLMVAIAPTVFKIFLESYLGAGVP